MPVVAMVAKQAAWELARRTAKLLALSLLGACLMLSGCTANAGLGLIAISGPGAAIAPAPGGGIVIGPVAPGVALSPGVPAAGFVTDAERYQLALVAWRGDVSNAILATAISFAEDGSGNPRALSAANFDGSRDYCLWQVNSGWWARFGGQEALAVPANCAEAAYVIFTLQGWCAWSTYEEACGRGHNGAYRAYLSCARILSVGGACN